MFLAPVSVERQTNPFVPTDKSIAAGRVAYESVCSSCHGDSGIGDGPSAGSLCPPPANPPVHIPLHTQGELFQIIRDGVIGTAMDALSGELIDDELWHLINYVRTVEYPGPR